MVRGHETIERGLPLWEVSVLRVWCTAYNVKSGAESEVFLPKETDDHGEERDGNLRGSGVPAPDLYQQFQTEIVNSQIERNNHHVTRELARAVKG